MNDAFVYSLKLDVVCPSGDDVSNLLMLFSSELNKSRDRSSYSVRKGDSSDAISFYVSSKDATALRASLNTITTNLQVYEKSRTFSSNNDLRKDEKFVE